MRISLFKLESGNLSVLLEPGRGRGLPPVYVQEVPPEKVMETVERELGRIVVAVGT